MSFFSSKKEKKTITEGPDDWHDIMIDNKNIPPHELCSRRGCGSGDKVSGRILLKASPSEPHSLSISAREEHILTSPGTGRSKCGSGDFVSRSIQKIISNQEKSHPNRLKTLQSLDSIIENQQVILGYIDTMTKKMNDMEYRIIKQTNQGLFSSYLRPSIFPHIDTDTQANSIRAENIIKRKSPKPNPKKN